MLRSVVKYKAAVNCRGLSQLVQVPLIFTGLFASLWLWKSLTLIVFQKKIIFMNYIGRHERLADFNTAPVSWSEHVITTQDGQNVVLCKSALNPSGTRRKVSILYLQGNAGSTPPRLPHLSQLLILLRKDVDATIWTLSYRGYWKSTGSPSEAGCLLDVQAAMAYINDPELILWGHSIGAGLAVLSADNNPLILETPFVSTMTLLKHIYPQRWLPYRYLSPFLRTRLDMTRSIPTGRVLIIQADKDEIVPSEETAAVYNLLLNAGVDVQRTLVNGLHMDCISKPQLHHAIVRFLSEKRI